ncbi:stationary phase survival protein SurE [Pedobacter sp. KBW06]|uniref:stationary phase survival protein SurE n=1 Tax=Pedobacter sp. KBW06 TaxID=2153359 RepID=UPI000F5A8C5B|nr:stationary phase survival protein SurE [Pedobacter sp. KBW06]RQO64550.1 stationary phase survival protein SurE [Pedobacter sp. KBW06]
MLKKIKDSVFIGLGIGILVPGILGSIVWFLMHRYAFLAKADLLLIACIAVNAGLLHYFFKLNKENLGRGIISATFMWAFVFFFYKINQ